MRQRFAISAAALVLILSALAPGVSGPGQAASGGERSVSQEEVRALVERVIANQHRNDTALEEYERLEHRVVRKSATDKRAEEDKTFRVVPTGTGTLRLVVKDWGQPVALELYRQQLRDWEQALTQTLTAKDADQKRRVEKWVKRTKERAEMVDAVKDALRATSMVREDRGGRTLVKLELVPNPAYKPTSRSTELFAHVRATAWIDESAAQLVRIEAEIIRDISFGGGILGKVYRGGRFVMEQQEAAPGVWLPTLYAYDFSGRKFLFGFEVHELTEVSHYRHVGPPKEALVAARKELSAGRASSDP